MAEPEPTVTVDGDATGGWIVQLHDGDRALVHTTMAPTAAKATAEAMKVWRGPAPAPAPAREA